MNIDDKYVPNYKILKFIKHLNEVAYTVYNSNTIFRNFYSFNSITVKLFIQLDACNSSIWNVFGHMKGSRNVIMWCQSHIDIQTKKVYKLRIRTSPHDGFRTTNIDARHDHYGTSPERRHTTDFGTTIFTTNATNMGRMPTVVTRLTATKNASSKTE
jgi:hypothetical protein